MRDRRAVAVSRQQRGGGRQISAGAVAGDRDAISVDRQSIRAVRDPAKSAIEIFEGNRIGMLRSQPVADRKDDAARRIGEGAAWIVVSLQRAENAALGAWLSEHRKARTQSIIDRLRQAKHTGEIEEHVDEAALGDCCATMLHGLSVQARDGVGADRLNAMVDAFLAAFDLMTTKRRRRDRASVRNSIRR